MYVSDIREKLSAHPEGTFIDVMPFNGAQVGACDITGESPVWEMHPDTDELFYVLEGELRMTVLADGDTHQVHARAGALLCIPKGQWHKPAAPDGAKFIYLTPGKTLHSDAEDPRTESA